MNMAFSPEQDANISIDRLDVLDAGDAQRIDSYVEGHGESTPFHRTAWMKAIKAACGHRFYYLVAEDRRGQIIGLLPLHLIHSALFGRAMVSSGFAVGGGILADNGTVVEKLAAAAWQWTERLSVESLELRGGPVPPHGWQIKQDVYAGFRKTLADNAEEQLLDIPRKQRAEVRKGLKNELTVVIGSGESDREQHYAVYAESVRNLGTPVFPKALFAEILNRFGDDADILTVLDNGRAVASVLSLYHKNTVFPYWGGGTWDARRLRANDVMYYTLMNHARDRKCAIFDFGRSKTGTGAYSFKKNWGFEPAPLSYAVKTADGRAARDINPMSPKYRMQVAIWQRLPLALANRIGPLLSRGLG